MRAIALAALLLSACASVTANPATLEGTNWRVTAIDRQATPAAGNYSMQFAGGNLGARFGCNSIGGRYSAVGTTLTATEVRSTLMGCPEPSATFEREGLAVLNQPMRMSWSSGMRLTLSNAAGAIALKRMP